MLQRLQTVELQAARPERELRHPGLACDLYTTIVRGSESARIATRLPTAEELQRMGTMVVERWTSYIAKLTIDNLRG